MVQSQISWQGKDGVAQRDVEFVGVIHAVTVDDIKGSQEVKTSTSTASDSSNSSADGATSKTETVTDGPITTKTKTEIFGEPGTGYYEEIVTVTVIDNTTGKIIKEDTTRSSNSSKSKNNEVITQTVNTYVMTEANIQYRLEGTWIEKNSPIVSRVDAISRGTYGIVTITREGAQELLPPVQSPYAPTAAESGSAGGGGD
ncbi:MAG: hypothetical protein M5U15_03250 [Kiritimatiellae bacterium]|nr:hypothetical protein [Kiritimatiellia bacterium]